MANVAMTVYIEESTRAQLIQLKELDGISIQYTVNKAVNEYLEKLHREGIKISETK